MGAVKTRRAGPPHAPHGSSGHASPIGRRTSKGPQVAQRYGSMGIAYLQTLPAENILGGSKNQERDVSRR
jgi:hypothetical protein